MFDDEVDCISMFDPLTGAILQRDLPRCTIYPKTHYVTPRERVLEAIDGIKDELEVRKKQLLENNKLVEEQRISQRTQFDIEMMMELGFCSGSKTTRVISVDVQKVSRHRPCLITCHQTAC